MQCLARAAARSARAAVEGYAGRRFLATGRGAGAAVQRRLATVRAPQQQDRMRSERLAQQKLLSELQAMGAKVDKLGSNVGADIARRFCAAFAGYLTAATLFEIFNRRSVGSIEKQE
ncbi:unnamed protein product [Urochloa decumbens]|uniref:Uncharacterized protein n=1 Tax=Urochloa decumbens TaxID=240449 RepID=A0ABC8YV57_9POAL